MSRAAQLLRRSLASTLNPGPKPTVPTSKALLGMVSENTAVTHAQSWATDVATIGRTLDYGSFYYHASDPYPVSDTTSLVPAPANLMITWFGWPDSEVNAGTHDAAITTRAQALAALQVPIFLRWDIEMNIISYSYEPSTTIAAGSNSVALPHTPVNVAATASFPSSGTALIGISGAATTIAYTSTTSTTFAGATLGTGTMLTGQGVFPGTAGTTFISAWQRVYGLFQAAGATNVAFVWCPNSNSPFDPNSWRQYYPGDAYVDWVGVDAYNFGNSATPAGSTWETIYQVLHLFVADWQGGFGGAGGSTKPLMIGEGASVEGGGSKPWWLTDFSGYLRTSGFKALTYYNTNQSSSGNNYRFDTSAASQAAFLEICNDPYFGGSSTKGSGFAAAVAADSPYAFWKLGETSGTFADGGSAGLTTAVTSGTMTRGCVTRAPGCGYGASWYGSGYVDLGVCGTFGAAMSAGFTLEFEMKDGGSAVDTTLGGVLNTGSTTGLQVGLNQNHLGSNAGYTYFWMRNEAGAQHYLDTNQAIYDGLWHHIMWVCNPGGVDALYIDGATITPTATASPAAGTTANFGFDVFIGGRNNRGSIDQTSIGGIANVALYKSKLSSTRATAHYTALTT